MEKDPFDLQRFVIAQASMFETALAEIRAGRKRSHWMWFVFPQLRGIGCSSTARYYGMKRKLLVSSRTRAASRPRHAGGAIQ